MENHIGKHVIDELYVQRSYIKNVTNTEFHELLNEAATTGRNIVNDNWNVIKVNSKRRKVSFLRYLDFESDPFPTLAESCSYSQDRKSFIYRDYQSSLNPPILHRKELLVGTEHPAFQKWSNLTKTAENIGLFDSPSVIGFKANWERLIFEKGYKLIDVDFEPIGNDAYDPGAEEDHQEFSPVRRHLTALSRANLSAPIQALIRLGLLNDRTTVFDYGCGRGDDVAGLQDIGIECAGWDPHYAPDVPIVAADVVNLGFVVNVIEDPAERVDAIHKAFTLARKVIVVSVMLNSVDRPGKPYRDGFITSRNTFQKYFSQDEIKGYLEMVLSLDVFMIGPGIALAFIDKRLEQSHLLDQMKSKDIAKRLLASGSRVPKIRVPKPLKAKTATPSKAETEYQKNRELLDQLWRLTLDYGRPPELDEVSFGGDVIEGLGSLVRARRLLQIYYDLSLLEQAAKTRSDEIRLFFAMQHFSRRANYKQLEIKLQRDVKCFYRDFKAAQASGLKLLQDCSNEVLILDACKEAASMGLGFLENEHSLQLHVSLVPRLPVVLRAYISCGLVLWGNISDIQLVKIHIASGKLTLLEYQNFDNEPIPLLSKRIKVNLHRLDYDLFEYGTEKYPYSPLYFKSRYLHEDMPGYSTQYEFDQHFEAIHDEEQEISLPSISGLSAIMERKRVSIRGFEILRSDRIPSLDMPCGKNFKFRDLIECGETHARLLMPNIPLNPETYNALYDLCVEILDPLIDYFGSIRLTYGFCSSALASKIDGRIAPKIDQHAGHELNRLRNPVCERLGAAVDFIVDDEDMSEVAQWIWEHTPFDRIYLYGKDKPLHVSHSQTPSKQVTVMIPSTNGRLIPRLLRRIEDLHQLVPK